MAPPGVWQAGELLEWGLGWKEMRGGNKQDVGTDWETTGEPKPGGKVEALILGGMQNEVGSKGAL